ncbi:hypothetical protein N7478_003980 [Penicillium angulare]|uniref:uncharacterized protein n=1 Tax=Penicillium angulare TaxID=116970 RepID=UPI0025424D61|nr:uncharacterized protein N7478_003980 [Penicillium angulare]KAJ5278608.1 hypothetical protein N7478_003980 [Penicillium angulare]
MARQQPGLACEECRRRKARCDRVRPQCGICTDSGRQCVYVDKRSPRGPKKGQLKELRSRMAVIEQQLASQGSGNEETSKVLESVEMSPEQDQPGGLPGHKAYTETDDDATRRSSYGSTSTSTANMSNLEDRILGEMPPGHPPRAWSDNKSFASGSTTLYSHRPASSMPTSPVKQSLSRMTLREGFERLNRDLLYFERVHPIIPMIHKDHYFSWARNGETSPTRACLRLAVRAIAAAMSAGFDEIADVLYARTRIMLETLDVQEPAEFPWATRPRSPHSRIDHELIQAWLLLAHCEFLRKSEQEALLTSGRAFTLLQLSTIFNVDMQNSLDSNKNDFRATRSFGPSSMTTNVMSKRAWVETEEMRRTIWTAFVLDRLSSMLNHRPPILHEEIVGYLSLEIILNISADETL